MCYKKGMNKFIVSGEGLPPLLQHVKKAPQRLHCLGLALEEKAYYVTIVGTRRATLYGKQMARDIGCALAQKGCTIVSGLAYGIDTEAHRGALEGGGKTIAVLGSGLQHISPVSNLRLAEKIALQGTIVTEYEDDIEPQIWTFPERNRIIAGMCVATIIIEAPEKSGALITAARAIEYDREVIAIPGNMTQPSCKGSNRLIERMHAYSPADIGDILERLKLERDTSDANDKKMREIIEELEGLEKTIFSLLQQNSPLDIDSLHERTHLPVHEINATLTCLEIKGLVRTSAGYAFVTR